MIGNSVPAYGAIEQPDGIIVTGDHSSFEALAMTSRCNDRIGISSDIDWPGFQGPNREPALVVRFLSTILRHPPVPF